MPGVVATRVGYSGGRHPRPTYHDLGDHTEAIEVTFDPARTSYAELLAVFWDDASAASPPWSRQYRTAIFPKDAEQRRLAEASLQAAQRERGTRLYVDIEDRGPFWQAEDYHQKYYLRAHRPLLAEITAMRPDDPSLVDSTTAARLNAWVGGYGVPAAIVAELELLGLSPKGRAALAAIVGR